MKIFISADIEGISGVVNKTHTMPQGHDYHMARTLMTNEVNAAIEGALEAGATEIVVNDSHGRMTNILLESLNPNAQLITGSPKKLGMMEGIDDSYNAALLIGYHARMNTPGVLSHSYHGGAISNISINGKDAGEFFINASVAGFYNVPVIVVSGDNILAEEVKAVDDNIETVVVKTAHARLTAKCLHPTVVHKAIKETVKNAILSSKVNPISLEGAIEMEVTFLNSGMAEMAAIMPKTEFLGGSKVGYRGKDIIEAYRALICMYNLANVVI